MKKHTPKEWKKNNISMDNVVRGGTVKTSHLLVFFLIVNVNC
jgi:hypothetical protein